MIRHVGRLMREAGWSRQKPVERASQRNEEAIRKWSQERWPALKKTVRAKVTSKQRLTSESQGSRGTADACDGNESV